MQFQDCVAIITGSGSGLGRVLAHHFAAEGAAIIVADVVGTDRRLGTLGTLTPRRSAARPRPVPYPL
jgi:NAD(P)-dependent dehydrogenase (short-subunit alcohol dehydrogenase family)